MFVPTHSYTHGPRYPMNPSTQQQQPASQPALMLFRLDLCPFSIQQAEWVDLPLIYFPPHLFYLFTSWSSTTLRFVLPQTQNASIWFSPSPLLLLWPLQDLHSILPVLPVIVALSLQCLFIRWRWKTVWIRARVSHCSCARTLELCPYNPITSVQLVLVPRTLG